MAQIVLILGESGTGKSASLRNFQNGELALVNVGKKPLPFRGTFNSVNSDDFNEISKFVQSVPEKIIVVDDAQYLMAFQYMRRIKENGWDKFNEIQSDFFNLIELAKSLPDDNIVFFLSHIETKDDGRQKIKTIGKMLDEKITIEGMFTVVLKTYVSDGKYYFITQNSGMDTVKSPIGMFPSITIDNDLKYVAEKIRNYYYMDGAKTDEEMKAADEAVKAEVNPAEKKSRRRRKAEVEAEPTADVQAEQPAEVPAVKEEPPVEEEQPKPRRRRRRTESMQSIEVSDEEIPF
ncbi:AAA family ATPase [uncultured Phascolarctobacterium sp.]|uniref:AAA family ATPase n=1 Tax=uncultured Phascolarctobacterium sp. TaxID=512296 RepID=UPI0027D9324D|nr:AAA family ATPase [uncultured Phascolarctobacterium sp.]